VATSNRAELRAAIAALECRFWGTEGWTHVTIATDSTYVVNGITEWVPKWKARQWTKATGEDVANKDLWMMLLRLVNKQARKGCSVRFWHISRIHNEQADQLAKSAANSREKEDYRTRDLGKIEAHFHAHNMD